MYMDDADALKEQLTRELRDFPGLEIARERGGSIDDGKLRILS